MSRLTSSHKAHRSTILARWCKPEYVGSLFIDLNPLRRLFLDLLERLIFSCCSHGHNYCSLAVILPPQESVWAAKVSAPTLYTYPTHLALAYSTDTMINRLIIHAINTGILTRSVKISEPYIHHSCWLSNSIVYLIYSLLYSYVL